MTIRLRFAALVLLFACAIAPFAPAHALPGLGAKKEEAPAEPAMIIDDMGRTTPRGAVAGFLDSISKENFEKASQYLDLGTISRARRAAQGPALAQKLRDVLDQTGWFYPAGMLNNEPEGRKDEDNIAEDIEKIGNMRIDGQSVDITAQRVADKSEGAPEGKQIWLISAATISALSAVDKEQDSSRINKVLPPQLVDWKWGGAPAGHWLAAIGLFAASYISAWYLIQCLLFVIIRLCRKTSRFASADHILKPIRLPLALYAAVWIFGLSSIQLGLSIIVRQDLGQLNFIVAWIAIALFAWRLVDIFAEIAQRRMIATGRFFGFSSILFFLRRIIKVIFAIIVFIIVLDNMGVDVTAGLAALGIGGIALALGAQKTLENFIGSLAIVIDQPVHIGDFCKIGDATTGTVEDIGMRSTRIRTNDRTLVTIPNGDLSVTKIENFARRNRFLMTNKFLIRYDAKASQLRDLVAGMKDIIIAARDSDQENTRPVRVLGFGDGGFIVEVFHYINVTDFNDFLGIQEDVMLQITDLVGKLGLYFVIPSQTFLPAVDQTGKQHFVLHKSTSDNLNEQ